MFCFTFVSDHNTDSLMLYSVQLKNMYSYLKSSLKLSDIVRGLSSLPQIHSRRVVVSYKRKYVHKLLVNRLFKPAQEKVWLGELTVPQ